MIIGHTNEPDSAASINEFMKRSAPPVKSTSPTSRRLSDAIKIYEKDTTVQEPESHRSHH